MVASTSRSASRGAEGSVSALGSPPTNSTNGSSSSSDSSPSLVHLLVLPCCPPPRVGLGILPVGAVRGGVSSFAVYSPDRIPSSTRVAKRVAVEVSSNGLSMQPAAAFLHQMQPAAAGKWDSVHARLNLEHSAQETTN